MKHDPPPILASFFSQLEELDALPLREFSEAERASTLASIIISIARQNAEMNRVAPLMRRGVDKIKLPKPLSGMSFDDLISMSDRDVLVLARNVGLDPEQCVESCRDLFESILSRSSP